MELDPTMRAMIYDQLKCSQELGLKSNRRLEDCSAPPICSLLQINSNFMVWKMV